MSVLQRRKLPMMLTACLALFIQSAQTDVIGQTRGPREGSSQNGQKAGPGASAFITVDFPQEHSLGRIFTLPKVWNVVDSPINCTFYHEAKGRVTLPAGVGLVFYPNGLISERPDYLAKFPHGSLQVLEALGLDINDQLLANIGRLSGLQRLDLNETDISDTGLANFKDLKTLRSLSINKTLFKGPGLASLAGLDKMEVLNISGNSLAPGTLKRLAPFKRLNTLMVTHCVLSDADLVDIAKVNTLTFINLSFNHGITDSGLANLKALKNLGSMDIDECHLSAKGICSLKGLPLGAVTLPPGCNNKADLALLHKTFPRAVLVFSHREKRLPHDFYQDTP
jgi:hypothetical protein